MNALFSVCVCVCIISTQVYICVYFCRLCRKLSEVFCSVCVCARIHVFICLWLRAWRHILLLVNYPKQRGMERKQWEGVRRGEVGAWERRRESERQRSDHLEPQVLSNIVSAPYCLSFTILSPRVAYTNRGTLGKRFQKAQVCRAKSSYSLFIQ